MDARHDPSMGLRLIYQMLSTLLGWIVVRARSETSKEIEILVLRHQLALLQRRTPRPPIYGAMFLGQSQVALAVAADLEASLPEELLRIEQPPMADYLEAFVPMRLHVLIRFGMWDDILALPLPGDPSLYCTTTAMTHYAQGVAYAATGRMEEAETAREAFLTAVARVPDSRYLFNNTCQDILAVAGAMLDGELEYRRGRFATAFEHLRRAIALDDALPYDEPWGLDAAHTPRVRGAAARAGAGCRGRDRLRRRPGVRPVEPALVLAPRQRVEPARLPRVPGSAGQARTGADRQAAARRRPRPCRRPDRVLLLLPHDPPRGRRPGRC
jgi:tetratricopeptide (TPR) repeat protein